MCVAIAAAGLQQPDASLPPALVAMADAERAFAAAARVKGVRDAFLEFFADDAMFAPGTGRAKDQLLKQQPQPFSVRELVWEPRTGDVAASGELGWLTGPGTFVDHAAADKTPRHTNYLSVWRKQPDGQWRVYIDVGTNLKGPATFEPGFVRFRFARRYTGKADKASAGDSLAAADRAFNARIESAGPAAAFAEVLAPGARVHREGVGALDRLRRRPSVAGPACRGNAGDDDRRRVSDVRRPRVQLRHVSAGSWQRSLRRTCGFGRATLGDAGSSWWTSCFNRGASPLELPYTRSRSPLRRLAPFAWLASLRSLASFSAAPCPP